MPVVDTPTPYNSEKGQTSRTRKSLREKTPRPCHSTVEKMKKHMPKLREAIEDAPFLQLPYCIGVCNMFCNENPVNGVNRKETPWVCIIG